MKLERALAWGVLLLSIAPPLLIGSVHPWTQVGLSLAALVLFGAYAISRGRHGLRVVPFLLPGVIAVGYTILQLVPLPAGFIRWLSPSAFELRADAAGGSAPAWMPLTLDVPATALEVIKGLACLGLMMCAVGVARSPQRSRRVLVAISLLAASLAVLAMVQKMTGAQDILGLYHPRHLAGTGVFGTFVNGNHAAALFSMGCLLSVGLALEFEAGARLGMLLAAGLTFAGVLLTTSRSGALGLGVGAFGLVGTMMARRFGWARGLAVGFVLILLGSGATLWVSDGLRARVLPANVENLVLAQKLRGWRDGMILARHYAWTGVGRGAFEAPLLAYRDDDESVRLVYPENVAVQASAEWGFPIALLLAALLFLAARRVVPRVWEREPSTVAAGCAVVAALVHDAGDFSLEFPGIAFPAAALLGIVIGRAYEGAGEARKVRLPVSMIGAVIGIWAVALVGSAFAAPHTLLADSDRLSKLAGAAPAAALQAALERHPADYQLELVAAEQAIRTKRPEVMQHLNRALWLHPTNSLAHRLAARVLAGEGHRAQAALEYRLASRGIPIPPEEIHAVVGDRIIDAVAQQPAPLFVLAQYLVYKKRIELAVAACGRAVELAGRSEASLVQWLTIAQSTRDPKWIKQAVSALLDSTPSPGGYLAAATALTQAGDLPGADEAIRRGRVAHPDAGSLVLQGARLRLEAKDVAGAQALLRHGADGTLSLSERKQAEELLADIADHSGDIEGAILARARARLLARKIKDSELGYAP